MPVLLLNQLYTTEDYYISELVARKTWLVLFSTWMTNFKNFLPAVKYLIHSKYPINCFVLFSPTALLPQGELRATFEGTLSLTKCWLFFVIPCFDWNNIRSFVMKFGSKAQLCPQWGLSWKCVNFTSENLKPLHPTPLSCQKNQY